MGFVKHQKAVSNQSRVIGLIPLLHRHDAFILLIAAIGSYLTLLFRLVDDPEKHLAKVDFTTIYDIYLLSRQRFGFFQDNLGIPWPLRDTGELVYYLDGLTAWFPFKDLLLYFIIPVLIGSSFFYKYFSYLASTVFQLPDAKFIGVAAACFIVFSPIIIYVFSFGWNIPLYWGLAGVALALHYGSAVLNNDRKKTLSWLGFFVGAMLAGIVLHFVFLIAALLISRKHIGKYFLLLCVIFIANSYYIVPELYKTLILGFGYYQGVDPVADGLQRFTLLKAYTRFSLLPDTERYYNVSHVGLLLITILALLGAFITYVKSIKIIHVVAVFLWITFFASALFEISVFNLLIHIPIFGGMFRDSAKIAVLVIVVTAFFSAVAVARFGHTARMVVMALVIGNCFYYVDQLHTGMAIKGYEIPEAYQKAYVAIEKHTNSTERVLLLPFPDWFHRYRWNDESQVQNLFRIGLNRPAILEESIPPRTLPPVIWEHISSFQSPNADCKELENTAYQYGIGAIVLQKDILEYGADVNQKTQTIKDNFKRCSIEPFYLSRQVDAHKVKPRALIEFCSTIDKTCIEAPFTYRFFGTVAEIDPSVHFDQLHLNYRYMDNSFGLLSLINYHLIFGKSSSAQGIGYTWSDLEKKHGMGPYYLVNTTAVVSLIAHGVELLFVIGLAGWIFTNYSRRNLI
jgi:hypothetical protein